MAGTVMATPICTTDRDHPVHSDSRTNQMLLCPFMHEIKKMEKRAGSPRTFKVRGAPPLPWRRLC